VDEVAEVKEVNAVVKSHKPQGKKIPLSSPFYKGGKRGI